MPGLSRSSLIAVMVVRWLVVVKESQECTFLDSLKEIFSMKSHLKVTWIGDIWSKKSKQQSGRVFSASFPYFWYFMSQNSLTSIPSPTFQRYNCVPIQNLQSKEACDQFGLLLFLWQVMVMQEGSTSLFGQHLKLPTLPNSSLTSTFSDPKKNKSFHGSKVSVVSRHSLELSNLLLCFHSQPHQALKCFTPSKSPGPNPPHIWQVQRRPIYLNSGISKTSNFGLSKLYLGCRSAISTCGFEDTHILL